jgi:hypothetical protein
MDTRRLRLLAVDWSNVTAYRTFVIGAEAGGAAARSARCARAGLAGDNEAAAIAETRTN